MTSLENKCKSIVFDNFDKYNEAYKTATNSRDKLKYVFLQRKYSNDLIKKLVDERKLDDPISKYFDFVINRYLKTLDTKYLEEIEWEIICKKFSEIGPNLEKVSFDHRRPWEEVICHCCNLLHVTFFPCTDLLLNCIAKFCPKIQSIEMYYPTISSNSLQVFSCQADGTYACPDLKEIILQPLNFVPYNFKEIIAFLLQNLPMIENIKCEGLPEVLYSMHKDHIHSLSNIRQNYNLTKLCVMADSDDNFYNHGHNFDDLLKICVSVCPGIKSLECRVFTEQHLTLISKFDKLQELLLKNEGNCFNIDNFLQLKGNMLILLKVSDVQFSPMTLLSNCSKLNILELNAVIWSENEKCSRYPIIGNLKELSIPNLFYHRPRPLSSQVARFLSSFPNLERLRLSYFGNDPEVQAAILRAVKLQYLDFSEFVTFNFLKDILLTCTSLTTLDLKDTILLDGKSSRGVLIRKLRHIVRTLINQPVILDYSFDYDKEDEEQVLRVLPF